MHNRFRIFVFLKIQLLFLLVLTAQSHAIETWSLLLGTNSVDAGMFVEPTSDGGHLIVGGLGFPNFGTRDTFAVKLSSSNQIQWQTSFYTPYDGITQTTGEIHGVVEVKDGYLISTNSAISKLNRNGTVLWHKQYVETLMTAVRPTARGFLIGFNPGDGEFSILKLKPDGEVESQQFYGSTDDVNTIAFVRSISTGGFVAFGNTVFANTGLFLMKANSKGEVQWWKKYSNSTFTVYFPHHMIKTSDGGYAICGSAAVGGRGNPVTGWLLKTDSGGNLEWQKIFSESGVRRLHQTTDGGFIAIGGRAELWKITASGNIQWIKTYIPGKRSTLQDVRPTKDGGYIAIGGTIAGHSKADVWVLKVDSKGRIKTGCLTVQKNPRPTELTFDIAVTNVSGTLIRSGKSKAKPVQFFPGQLFRIRNSCNL